jgi:hypothetical protein
MTLLEIAPSYVRGNRYNATGTMCRIKYLQKFRFPIPRSCPCHFKYGAMNIYVRHGNYIVNSQGLYEVAQKLEEPRT